MRGVEGFDRMQIHACASCSRGPLKKCASSSRRGPVRVCVAVRSCAMPLIITSVAATPPNPGPGIVEEDR